MFQDFLDKVRGARRSMTMWVNAAFLAMLPFADSIIAWGAPVAVQLAAAMPELQPYLPDNIYKVVGGVAVGINILLRFKTKLPLDAK